MNQQSPEDPIVFQEEADQKKKQNKKTGILWLYWNYLSILCSILRWWHSAKESCQGWTRRNWRVLMSTHTWEQQDKATLWNDNHENQPGRKLDTPWMSCIFFSEMWAVKNTKQTKRAATFLNLHRANLNNLSRWFDIEAISIGHHIYAANYIRTSSSNQNLLKFSGDLNSPLWKKTSLNRLCRRNRSRISCFQKRTA